MDNNNEYTQIIFSHKLYVHMKKKGKKREIVYRLDMDFFLDKTLIVVYCNTGECQVA